MTTRCGRGPAFTLPRDVYSEARRRWIAGEREELLPWLAEKLGREVNRTTLSGFARRNGWPALYRTGAPR